MEGSVERIPERRDTGMTHSLSIEPNDDWLCDYYWGDPEEEEEEEEEECEDEDLREEQKAIKIGRILQSYGDTRRDETKEGRDGWNCI